MDIERELTEEDVKDVFDSFINFNNSKNKFIEEIIKSTNLTEFEKLKLFENNKLFNSIDVDQIFKINRSLWEHIINKLNDYIFEDLTNISTIYLLLDEMFKHELYNYAVTYKISHLII